MDRRIFIHQQTHRWENDTRWHGIQRPYDAEALWKLVGSVRIDHTLARQGSSRIWAGLVNDEDSLQWTTVSCRAGIPEALEGNEVILVIKDDHPSTLREVASVNRCLLQRNRNEGLDESHGPSPVVPVMAALDPRHLELEDILDLAGQMIECGAGGFVLLHESRSAQETLEKLQIVRLACDISGVDAVVVQLLDGMENGLTDRLEAFATAADALGPGAGFSGDESLFLEMASHHIPHRPVCIATHGSSGAPRGYSFAVDLQKSVSAARPGSYDRRYARRAVGVFKTRPGKRVSGPSSSGRIPARGRAMPEIGIMPGRRLRASNE